MDENWDAAHWKLTQERVFYFLCILYNNLNLNHHIITFAKGKFPWYFECATQQFKHYSFNKVFCGWYYCTHGIFKRVLKNTFYSKKNCLYFFFYLQKAKYNFWWNIYSNWMVIILRHIAGIPCHFMHSKSWNFQSIWIPFSKIQLVKYRSLFLDFEAAFWKTLLSN